jgi:hypothetical protein
MNLFLLSSASFEVHFSSYTAVSDELSVCEVSFGPKSLFLSMYLLYIHRNLLHLTSEIEVWTLQTKKFWKELMSNTFLQMFHSVW